jgi:chloride channel 3/4/5
VMYMSSGSGIPEIKTILSGFSIPSFLSLPVLLAKALGAIFAVASGLCLGKEGPFVHISTCTGYQIGSLFPKYSSNGRKMRELLSAACSSGLSVAFGAPIGGVLFSYEEISTFFPRGVMGMAFLCSLTAAAVLKVCNPSGTGKLVLFETNYSAGYGTADYLLFTFLGIVGGVFGGVFCRANFWWSKWFRSFSLIRKNPVLEVGLVVAVTGLLQFPNPLIRDAGDVVIKNLLVDCNTPSSSNKTSYVCANEANPTSTYLLTLTLGTLSKLLLTTLTFGLKIPSGVIIPALDAGALFGRLTALLLAPATPPGLFALVSSAAFLAGVTRTTLSLAVIMFELTGQLSHTVPCMLAILVAKLTADAISKEGVYDLAQSVLGHPFLDGEVSLGIVGGRREMRTEVLVPPRETMEGITVVVPVGNTVRFALLKGKLDMLKERGLMDAGLVLVQSRPPSEVHVLQGYISQAELEFGLEKLAPKGVELADVRVRVLGHGGEEVETAVEGLELDLTPFVDRTPLTVCAKAPLEYAVEMFSKLGLRYLCVTEEGTGALVGVVIKKRLVGYLEHLREHGEEDE